MRALTIIPGRSGSLELRDIDEPDEEDGPVLVDVLSMGLCGTDREIVSGNYGEAPEGQAHLVLGHENLGRVAQCPEDGPLKVGDLVVCIVRQPDPVPCPACAAGQWDMCLNGRYTEHGIKGVDGFGRERYRAHPKALVKLPPALSEVGVLLEPATILAKAWQHIEAVGSRAYFEPKVAVVTGAGPVGLLAAMMGVQRGLDVHVFDRVTDGVKPELVRDLGATYHTDSITDSGVLADVLLECTGVAPLILETITRKALNGITCLTGVSSPGKTRQVDLGSINREIVLDNEAVFGSVNANRGHYEAAVDSLAKADIDWLRRLITRRVPIEDFKSAFQHDDGDVKVVLELGGH